MRGIALANAELAAYRAGSEEIKGSDPNSPARSAKELCAKLGDGTDSVSFWSFMGALAGVAAALLPTLL